jgi:glucosamine 6-phosphate synthetase-like amidotransferase/phosphosugar isomerase protein
MCGIAGFSLSKNSNINVQDLAASLLCSIETRGGMAAGYAFTEGGTMGAYKAPITGSQLELAGLPKASSNVILHTRLATHGSIDDNNNNHPVWSPDNSIALVHNGVIYNHKSVRTQFTETLPEVDTSVIPALIEQQGIQGLSALSGDAAIAWFDRNDTSTLNVARYQHSPLVVAQVEDGSFIFCSTEKLLWDTLIEMDLTPTWMETAKELDYYTVREGVITSKTSLPKPAPAYTSSSYDYDYYRHQTAGAVGNAPSPAYKTSAWSSSSFEEEDEYDNYAYNSVAKVDVYDEVDTGFTLPSIGKTNASRYYIDSYEYGDRIVQYYSAGEKYAWEADIESFKVASKQCFIIDCGEITVVSRYTPTK